MAVFGIHPVVDQQLGLNGVSSDYMADSGGGIDTEGSSAPHQTIMDAADPFVPDYIDKTPHWVAILLLGAIGGLALLKLAGFRFSVGGSIGG